MQTLDEIFGIGRNLTMLQMTARSVVVFVTALVLLRISGRRSFGLRTPLDNIITIVLGAVLSRAIVGESPFFSVIASCTMLVVLHRLLAYGMVHHPGLSKLIAGEKMLLYKDGKFDERNMNKAQVCREELLQEVRKTVLTEDLNRIEKIYIERNGEVNSIKKER